MKYLSALILIILLSSCGVQYKLSLDTSLDGDNSYVYALPFPPGKSHLLIQGYNSRFTHRGRLNLDFKMNQGSPIHAARGGVVTHAIGSFKNGGLNKRYFRRANMVVILHEDGTQAYYGHLKHEGIAVKVGDTVAKHQLIGYSGNTGYSAFPHLHFVVRGQTPQGYRPLPTRFQTRKGARYLKPGKWYQSI